MQLQSYRLPQFLDNKVVCAELRDGEITAAKVRLYQKSTAGLDPRLILRLLGDRVNLQLLSYHKGDDRIEVLQ